MPVNFLIALLVGGVTLAWAGVRSGKALHLLQLDSYANDRFLQWLAVDPWRRVIEWPSALCHIIFLAVALLQPTPLLSAPILLIAWRSARWDYSSTPS